MYSPNFNINNCYDLWSENTDSYHLPLNAYPPEYPGVSGYRANGVSNSIQMKLNRLNTLKFYGYKSLKPIGINKTMEQLDYENNLAVEPNVTSTLENDLVTLGLNVDLQLDEDIPNFDSGSEDINVDDDEGFMAEEVEYQNDHSLGTSTVGPSLVGPSIVGPSSGGPNGIDELVLPLESAVSSTAASATPLPNLGTGLTEVEEADAECEEDMVLDEDLS